ncbi:hypothetical protein CONLIGDRAFT_630401 [Coniochaeta ligniaria NRRL 30616]|uniref:Uncharacterized protein n=1 Tax=Coniochaeta ligniaria NRRL 30616 TaxID=1408157 RepID=A0A1J7JS21_9PEZI|nr:hypothetical protein CONLIGDRAFT_630401 [Coniochaeta ligniaria NRRL 30616]
MESISYAPPPAAAVPAGASPLPVGPVPAPYLPGQSSGPTYTTLPLAKQDIRDRRSSVEFALREYMSLQRRRYRTDEVGIEERLRVQAAHVLTDLQTLRNDTSAMVKTAESHRWRRWITGTVVASFIPAIRAIFRRPTGETETSNHTEYAFRKSRSLIARIRDSVHGKGRFAALAFFVFAVLYVFSNEVSLRVARTVSKRLKRLSAKIENGQEDIDEKDMKLLSGWRWRVLLWNH